MVDVEAEAIEVLTIAGTGHQAAVSVLTDIDIHTLVVLAREDRDIELLQLQDNVEAHGHLIASLKHRHSSDQISSLIVIEARVDGAEQPLGDIS